MLKIGIIGCGGISVVHIGAYDKLKSEGYDVSIEAYCDVQQSQLDKFGDARKYLGIDDFMAGEKGKLDIVNICLPTFLHCSTAVKALENGFNVIIEKPMALSYEECLKMCETAKRTGKLFMVAQCVRWSNIVQAAKKYMAEGTFGKVKTACFKRDGGLPRWGWNDWFTKEEMSGGAILDMHVHDVDALHYLFGMPESVSCGASKINPGVGYDIVSTNYYYKNGLFTHSTTDWTTDNNIYYNNGMRVDFEKGYLISASFGGQYIFRAMGTDGSSVDLIPEYGGDDFYYKEVKYFVDCLLAGKPVTECLPETTAESIRIALTEKLSASKNGERIYL